MIPPDSPHHPKTKPSSLQHGLLTTLQTCPSPSQMQLTHTHSPAPAHPHTHTCTPTHAHPYMHIHRHPHTQTPTDTRPRAPQNAHALSHLRLLTLAIQPYTRSHIHTCTHGLLPLAHLLEQPHILTLAHAPFLSLTRSLNKHSNAVGNAPPSRLCTEAPAPRLWGRPQRTTHLFFDPSSRSRLCSRSCGMNC